LKDARRILKRFPGIQDPGADRILLFGGIAPLPAIPSAFPHVIVRVVKGEESASYTTTYKEAAKLLDERLPAAFDARKRAYLLLKSHGQEVCKREKPKCELCVLRTGCRYVAGK
jgi:endonuclease-3